LRPYGLGASDADLAGPPSPEKPLFPLPAIVVIVSRPEIPDVLLVSRPELPAALVTQIAATAATLAAGQILIARIVYSSSCWMDGFIATTLGRDRRHVVAGGDAATVSAVTHDAAPASAAR